MMTMSHAVAHLNAVQLRPFQAYCSLLRCNENMHQTFLQDAQCCRNCIKIHLPEVAAMISQAQRHSRGASHQFCEAVAF